MQRKALRELFPNETIDFTPWLAKNNLIPDIMNQLHIFQNSLILHKTEIAVSNYRMDMVYRETAGRNCLIVENQYGQSDSQHLGQIITYSTLTKIPTILWLSESVGLEHRRISRGLKEINIIASSIQFYEIGEGYLMNITVYGNETKVFSYKLNENLEIEYRK